MHHNEGNTFSIQIKIILNHLDLDAEEYADNLISYLDNARSVRSITLNDLNNVLHGLANTIPLANPDSQNKDGFVIGGYVAAF